MRLAKFRDMLDIAVTLLLVKI